MKSKFLFAKICFGILISTILLVGCNDKSEFTNISSKGNFNGLYTVEYAEYDVEYIWIFTDDLKYVLYPGMNSRYSDARTSISYETPTHYFVDGNNFYSCGIDNISTTTSLKDCKYKKKEPSYNIKSIDTIEDTYFKDKYQLIELEDFYTKSSIKLKKSL